MKVSSFVWIGRLYNWQCVNNLPEYTHVILSVNLIHILSFSFPLKRKEHSCLRFLCFSCVGIIITVYVDPFSVWNSIVLPITEISDCHTPSWYEGNFLILISSFFSCLWCAKLMIGAIYLHIVEIVLAILPVPNFNSFETMYSITVVL